MSFTYTYMISNHAATSVRVHARVCVCVCVCVGSIPKQKKEYHTPPHHSRNLQNNLRRLRPPPSRRKRVHCLTALNRFPPPSVREAGQYKCVWPRYGM